MNETIRKLETRIAELTAQQETALAAAEADGVSAEDREKHLAEFDKLQAEKEKAKASLARASQMARDSADLAAMRAQPGTAAVVQQPHNPNPPVGANRLPAQFRRHGPLRAFRGEHAAERAELAGRWAAAAIYGHAESIRWCNENAAGLLVSAPQATLTSTNNSGAGYFVPDVVEYAIQELALEYGVLRREAEVVNMPSESHSTPRWTAGMVAYWIAQGNAPTSSDPAWDMVQLVARDMGAMTKMRRQLDEDSAIELGDKITMAIAEAFSYAEDNAGFNGDGSSTYGGIHGLLKKADVAAAKATALATHTALSSLTMADFLAAPAKLPAYPGISPKWYCHQVVYYNAMLRLSMAAGGVTPADIAAGSTRMFLGYPVVFVNAMPSTFSSGDICALFADLKLSTKVGNRRGRTVERGFENDDFTKQLITVLGTQRVDIVNHTVVDPRNANNPGPVIALELAAA